MMRTDDKDWRKRKQMSAVSHTKLQGEIATLSQSFVFSTHQTCLHALSGAIIELFTLFTIANPIA